MDSDSKNSSQNRNTSHVTSYNPWNLLFSPRNRTNSETSVSSNTSQSSQQEIRRTLTKPLVSETAESELLKKNRGTQFGTLQRQTSKNEEYLWMMWRS